MPIPKRAILEGSGTFEVGGVGVPEKKKLPQHGGRDKKGEVNKLKSRFTTKLPKKLPLIEPLAEKKA